MTQRKRRAYPDLDTFFAESGHDQRLLGSKLDRSQAWVSRVKNRITEPSIAEALLISRLTGVPLESLIVHQRTLSAPE